MRLWYDDTLTSPFVNEEKHSAFKKPSYTGIPVLVSCMSLRDRIIAACGQPVKLDSISSHFRIESQLQFMPVLLFPLLFLKGLSFHGYNVFLVPGFSSF